MALWRLSRFPPGADVVSNNADLTSVDALKLAPGTDGVISLREAILAANADTATDTIVLGAGVFNLTIGGDDSGPGVLASYGDLDIKNNTIIVGAGADYTHINGATGTRILEVVPGVTLVLQEVTVSGGALFRKRR